MSRKLQLKRGAKASLPVLEAGEPGFTTDEQKLYIGTGSGNIAMAREDHNHDGVYQPAGSYLTSESDPTVPAWAKQPAKPAYTASEVGADAAGSAAAVQTNLTSHTGNQNNPHNVTAAQVGAAASVHYHAASNITSGTLSITRGGTGVTSVGGTDYTTTRFRGSQLRSADTTPTTNGTINWTYE